MKLNYLSITKSWSNADEYDCSVQFAVEGGHEVKLKLPKETTDKIRAVVADLIVEAAQKTANQVAREAIVGNLLPSPEA